MLDLPLKHARRRHKSSLSFKSFEIICLRYLYYVSTGMGASFKHIFKNHLEQVSLKDNDTLLISWNFNLTHRHFSLTLTWASTQKGKIEGRACAGNAGSGFHATVGLRSRHPSRNVRDSRAVMHAGVTNYRFHLKSVVGKTLPVFPAHAQPVILRIWSHAHSVINFSIPFHDGSGSTILSA